MFEDQAPLSAAGVDRREQILRAARSEARRRRRGRHLRRAAAAGLLAAVVVFVGLRSRPGNPPPGRLVIAPAPATTPAVAPPPAPPRRRPPTVVVTFIKTDPDLARRLAVPPQRPTWRRLDDDELLRQLAAAGRPAGLAWVDGREMVLFRGEPISPDSRSRGSARSPLPGH